MNEIRKKAIISGIVQGVGFRPTVFRYANECSLKGFVGNDSEGVFIEIQGEEKKITKFLELLKKYPPPLSTIDSFLISSIPIVSESQFSIIKSQDIGDKSADISPDIRTCNDCLNDIKDQSNRRYNYPFTNCTNCGPRFTIIKDRPYDRPLTSMANFKMCNKCLSEYDDPVDRRFHAQPNCCPECGPKLIYFNKSIKTQNSPIDLIKDDLNNELIVAIKGLGGFNIACLAKSSTAIKKLRKVKKRPSKSFALMAKDIEQVKKIAFVNEAEERELLSTSAPIVLLKKRVSSFDKISPDNNYLGVMLPYTPIHHILFKNFDYLLMTSANLKDEPICTDDKSISKLLELNIIDSVLDHDREIIHRADDSIVQVIKGKTQVIRRSRGIVPTPITIDSNRCENSLSLGANMKNTFSVRKDKKIYISQHIGELIDYQNYLYQKSEIEDFLKLLEITPEITKSDAHPGYENYNSENSLIYHHHAHMISAMGEHNLLGLKTLGVIADGTGFGTNESIWGFEFLKVSENYKTFERVCHLQEFPLPGGEVSLKEIERITIALLKLSNCNYQKDYSVDEKSINMLIKSNLNCPKTSSLGRLFDGVSALIGITQHSDYEAFAAISLQKYAEDFKGTIQNCYKVELTSKDILKIEYKNLIHEIVNDLKSGLSKGKIAKKFHLWVVNSISAVIKESGSKRVVFSGGCFQNRLLTELLIESLPGQGIEYYFNQSVPINDAGISFGQSLLQ